MRKLIIVSLIIVVSLFHFSPVFASDTISIFYAGELESNVRIALGLAPTGTFTFVDDPAQADVFVLNGDIPQTEIITKRLNEGAGLVLILGESISQEQASAVLQIPIELTQETVAVSLTGIKNLNDPLLKEIIWNGAPQVRDRFDVVTPISSVQPLVTAYETNEWILWSAHGGKTGS